MSMSMPWDAFTFLTASFNTVSVRSPKNHKAGITAIIQPGGSIRDKDCIDKCNEYGIAMVFTGMRHFKH